MYAGAYIAAVLLAGGTVRLWVGNLALLVSPLVAVLAFWRRRREWRGCELVFQSAIGAAALLWLVGQIGWATHELLFAKPQPWLDWHITLQLTGSTVPLLALMARPDRGRRDLSAPIASIDIAVLTTLVGFLYWTLIIAPGFSPDRAPLAIKTLAVLALGLRAAVALSLFWAFTRTRGSAWATVYQRLAIAVTVSLIALSVDAIPISRGTYHTGMPGDVGWILPFWLYAWAIAAAPASECADGTIGIAASARLSRPTLLFAAIAIVPIIGYGYRYVLPFGDPIDEYREVATAAELVIGLGLMVIRLIVEQHATERAEARMRLVAAALEQVDELIVIVRKLNVVWANDAFCRAFGYTLTELERMSLDRMVPEGSMNEFLAMKAALALRKTFHAKGELLRADGTTFPAECDASTIVDSTGKPYFIGVVRDVTDDLRIREQLVRGERLAAVAELVSGVAHELNNPLQSVIGRVDLLLSDVKDEAARLDLQRVRADATRAGRIVRNLLTFVRKAPHERMLGDLNEVVHATAALRDYELKLANIRIEESYSTDLPLVLINREEIQQIVLNLLLNAEMAITGARLPGTIWLRTFVSGSDAVLEAADDGPGVPPEYRKQIFEPFFTTRDDGKSTGLGLSIAFGIAQAHGGRLELTPSGKGASFRLTLPGAGFPGPPVHPGV